MEDSFVFWTHVYISDPWIHPRQSLHLKLGANEGSKMAQSDIYLKNISKMGGNVSFFAFVSQLRGK